MKGSGSVSWDSCGCECSKCVSYVFICILLCFIILFMFISSEIFWVRLGRIQFYCFVCGKISCSVFFFCWKGFMFLCPFHTPQQSLHSTLFQTKLLHFSPALPHEVICAFVLNSLFFADRWSHTICYHLELKIWCMSISILVRWQRSVLSWFIFFPSLRIWSFKKFLTRTILNSHWFSSTVIVL